ncbi:MAG: ATP-binding protein [Burkholderiaceae bacterium]|jgi:two-component system sensor histidine kinase DctS|nr:ATP-binding protein [Burkholderiaceae bacterium]MCZ8175665.1 ATP-binding protein [Burkholderiaceae bacterium]
MTPPLPTTPGTTPAPRLAQRGRARRVLLWTALMALLVVAQSLLVALSLNFESGRAQDDTERVATLAAAEIKRELMRQARELQALGFPLAEAEREVAVAALLRQRHGLERVERRGEDFAILRVQDTPYPPTLFAQMPRSELLTETQLACAAARIVGAPRFSRTYFVPMQGGQGTEVVDLCVPLSAAEGGGTLVGSFSLVRLLERLGDERAFSGHELTLVEPDGTRLARAGATRGAGVFVARQVIDLPGFSMQVRADGTRGRPSLVPNLTTALVVGLSLALFAVAALLARDGRRRAEAERALAEALALRRAMEDSLPTGLRARDLRGRVTYANPAFCAMVGLTPQQLLGPAAREGAGGDAAPPADDASEVQPYWPPEYVPEYRRRLSRRLQGQGYGPNEAREGVETVFMRSNGERFPVMVYEAPLVDGEGRQTGWMSAVVDLSAQRRVEELSRQQQERLQASARLATVGEMASLLSHELNQPLAAIASYASGSLNLMDGGMPEADPELRPMLRQALQRIAEQADRAGRVIKSVHAFVRRREQQHESIGAEDLFEAVLPLVRLQARKSGTRIEVRLPAGPARLPSVRCDRTMVEQVLLNLSRNGIQAMDAGTDPEQRLLVLAADPAEDGRRIVFTVADQGPGIPAEVAARLFTPFFTTRAEGMGLGLSLCRTVAEQHGGALDFGPGPQGRGTAFRFSLPVARAAAAEAAASQATPPGAFPRAAGIESGDTAGSEVLSSARP